MNEKICGLCFGDADQLFEAPCHERPEKVTGPIGMYHCPDCGMMLVAGFEHPTVCSGCHQRIIRELVKYTFGGASE